MDYATCHPDRARYAKDLCRQCYDRDYNANRRPPRKRKSYYVRKDPSEYAPNFRKPAHKPARVPDCHPDRAHVALGLCRACYQRDRAERPRATCEHSDRPAVADGKCNACYKLRAYWDSPEEARLKARESQGAIRKRVRDELVEAYGGKCACRNCPEANSAFLTLEHVNGDGKAHRMKMGSHTYADLRRRGFPQEGYTLLCWNCNAMTRNGRTCPHEEN